jgi:hypothetical protein
MYDRVQMELLNEITFLLLVQIFEPRERASSLVVTRAPVAPQILGSTPRGSEYLKI